MKKILITISIVFGLNSYSQVFKAQNLQITGGSPGLNKVLTSDNYGNVSWQSLGSLGLIQIQAPFVTSGTGQIWMDRNLGATRVATSMNDYLAFGDLYQWGRGSDGHQTITYSSSTSVSSSSPVDTNLSGSDNPGSSFISNTSGLNSYDWRNPSNITLWQGVNGKNNPCPTGFKVPTLINFNKEINYYGLIIIGTDTASKAYGNTPMKFVSHILRNGKLTGAPFDPSYGCLWTSTLDTNGNAFAFSIGGGQSTTYSYEHVFGFNVRCIYESGN